MTRRGHGDRELGAVARGQVLVAVVLDRLVIDARIPGLGRLAMHRYRCRLVAAASESDSVAGARLHTREHHATLGVGGLPRAHATLGVEQRRTTGGLPARRV